MLIVSQIFGGGIVIAQNYVVFVWNTSLTGHPSFLFAIYHSSSKIPPQLELLLSWIQSTVLSVLG